MALAGPGAGKLIEEFGLVAQGRGRRAIEIATWSGRIRHSVYFSVIASEWPEVKTALEAKIMVD